MQAKNPILTQYFMKSEILLIIYISKTRNSSYIKSFFQNSLNNSGYDLVSRHFWKVLLDDWTRTSTWTWNGLYGAVIHTRNNEINIWWRLNDISLEWTMPAEEGSQLTWMKTLDGWSTAVWRGSVVASLGLWCGTFLNQIISSLIGCPSNQKCSKVGFSPNRI